MLGIRKFQGIAINLFCGDAFTFCSSLLICYDPSKVIVTSEDKGFEPYYQLVTSSPGYAADLVAFICEIEALRIKETGSYISLLESLAPVMEKNQIHHVSIKPVGLEKNKKDFRGDPGAFFTDLHNFIIKGLPPVDRISVVLETLDQFFYFQEHLYNQFPE